MKCPHLYFSATGFRRLLTERFKNGYDWFTQFGEMPMPSILKSGLTLCAPGGLPTIGSGSADLHSDGSRRLFPGASLVHQHSDLLFGSALLFLLHEMVLLLLF